MKLTKSKLKEIIREELQKFNEAEKLDLKNPTGYFSAEVQSEAGEDNMSIEKLVQS